MTGTVHPDVSMRALKLAQTATDAATVAKSRADKAVHEAMAARTTADANSLAIRESADRCAENFGSVARELGEIRDSLRTVLELLIHERGGKPA